MKGKITTLLLTAVFMASCTNWILDDYGIRDWVESLPTRSISMATLANSYRIIGL